MRFERGVTSQNCCEPVPNVKPERVRLPKNCKIEAVIAVEGCSCKNEMLNKTHNFINDVARALLNEHRENYAELSVLGWDY